ncbi:hypothetical protein [Elizabethkingia anophelis]|uniref:hypothetical protein n=1 Tax=Elizabethkingia anophelis TaxID=1117645 RepID=UPI0021AA40A1|nr:hypothetical protein [Elizabethkingia anophelis]
MKARQDIAVFLLRIALAVGFLSAVSSRLNLWGVQSSGWSKFVRYTAEVILFCLIHGFLFLRYYPLLQNLLLVSYFL